MGFLDLASDQDPTSNKSPPQDVFDFAPGILGVQDRPPSPLPRMVLRGVLILILALLLWAMFGRLDIVSVAEGKLVPVSYLKIVQPSEAGIVREIAIMEGQQVEKDQLLIRMDANISEADSKSIQNELQHKTLELRRIEAELSGKPFKRESTDSVELFNRIYAEYQSNRRALEDDIASEQASQQKAYSDLAATREIQHKLEQTLPSYQAQEAAYDKLVKDELGLVLCKGKLMIFYQLVRSFHETHTPSYIYRRIQKRSSTFIQRARFNACRSQPQFRYCTQVA